MLSTLIPVDSLLKNYHVSISDLTGAKAMLWNVDEDYPVHCPGADNNDGFVTLVVDSHHAVRPLYDDGCRLVEYVDEIDAQENRALELRVDLESLKKPVFPKTTLSFGDFCVKLNKKGRPTLYRCIDGRNEKMFSDDRLMTISPCDLSNFLSSAQAQQRWNMMEFYFKHYPDAARKGTKYSRKIFHQDFVSYVESLTSA